MKKTMLTILAVFAAANIIFAQNCPYTYEQFINNVYVCDQTEDIKTCAALATQCPDIRNNKNQSAAMRIAYFARPATLKAMFEAGLELPLKYKTEKEYVDNSSRFICDMVKNYHKGTLSLEKFKILYKKAKQKYESYFCTNDDAAIHFSPLELAMILGHKELAHYMQSTSSMPDYYALADFKAPQGIFETEEKTRWLAYLQDPKYIRFIDKNFDYSILMPFDTEVLVVGEYHYGQYYKEVTRIAKSLQCKGGLTHFASEFLLEMQEEDIAKFKETGNDCYLNIEEDYTTGRDDVNRYCLNALFCDINILPLERNKDLLGRDYKDSKAAKKKLRDLQTKKAPETEIIAFDQRLDRSNVTTRNFSWTELITKTLKTANKPRMLAYMGKGHSHFNIPEDFNVGPLLIKEGVKAKSVSIVGEHFAMAPDSLYFRHFGLENKHFVFFVPKEFREMTGTDYFIHLPTNGKQEKKLKKYIEEYSTTYDY
ncbi:hypothetical protein AAIR98_001228 [Elusimicrobium simillimum]|uniref:hypothetical protein n=1 Tax=Elusimicrobium simillimum TaxID=3143438 RepID=UPI003C6FC6DC